MDTHSPPSPSPHRRKKRTRALTNTKVSPSPKKRMPGLALKIPKYVTVDRNELSDILLGTSSQSNEMPKQKASEVQDHTGMLSSKSSNDLSVCDGHDSCGPVPKEQFLDCLRAINTESWKCNKLVNPLTRTIWIGGQILADEALKKERGRNLNVSFAISKNFLHQKCGLFFCMY